MLQLPTDPIMLLSVVNTRLRDNYASLDELCEDLQVDRTALESSLHEVGFDYIPEQNQFR